MLTMKIDVLTAVEQIRANPSMYFDRGVPTNSQLLAAVLTDLSEHTGFHAEVIQEGSFTFVGANVDWLKTDRVPFEELFVRFVTSNARAPNTFRAEVLLAAVCEGILVLGEGAAYSQGLTLERLPPTIASSAKTKLRSLVWKFTR
jgi:hypothetical protein